MTKFKYQVMTLPLQNCKTCFNKYELFAQQIIHFDFLKFNQEISKISQLQKLSFCKYLMASWNIETSL